MSFMHQIGIFLCTVGGYLSQHIHYKLALFDLARHGKLIPENLKTPDDSHTSSLTCCKFEKGKGAVSPGLMISFCSAFCIDTVTLASDLRRASMIN